MAFADSEQIKKVADFIKTLPQIDQGLNFYSFTKDGKEIIASDMYPELNHPSAIDFFFFCCLHQYGFWHGDEKGYCQPLYGMLDGKLVKGSDLIWKVSKKALDRNQGQFKPRELYDIAPHELVRRIFHDDNGPILFPDFETRFQLTRAYARTLLVTDSSPEKIVEIANANKNSLEEFLYLTGKIPGFNKDPLMKKNLLLAMALANRPEKFLKVNDPQNWTPIVDYHLMRVSLRLGLVVLHDRRARFLNEAREWVLENEEENIRYFTHQAVQNLIEQSGLSMFAIDKLLWMARRYCPEMEEPDCEKCIFTSVCKKDTTLFQPVFRTTAY